MAFGLKSLAVLVLGSATEETVLAVALKTNVVHKLDEVPLLHGMLEEVLAVQERTVLGLVLQTVPLATVKELVVHDPAHSALATKNAEYGVQCLGHLELAVKRLSVCGRHQCDGRRHGLAGACSTLGLRCDLKGLWQ